jgi:hypothetical protein
MIYELMKHHFELQHYPGIDYKMPDEISLRERDLIQTMEQLENTLKDFRIKLAAALARIRIEKRAVGETFEEMMRNILPEAQRVKEETAGMILTFHSTKSKCQNSGNGQVCSCEPE